MQTEFPWIKSDLFVLCKKLIKPHLKVYFYKTDTNFVFVEFRFLLNNCLKNSRVAYFLLF